MNWNTFKNELVKNPDLRLQFQYADGHQVKGGYHITEIKQAQITSVDCGGKMNTWTEVVVQLWEPALAKEEESMLVSKAMKIVHLVENQLPLPGNATVKIEFGNAGFNTQQMLPDSIESLGENLVINLQPDVTQCKAIGRGQTCGTPKVELVETETACCTPGGGCC